MNKLNNFLVEDEEYDLKYLPYHLGEGGMYDKLHELLGGVVEVLMC